MSLQKIIIVFLLIVPCCGFAQQQNNLVNVTNTAYTNQYPIFLVHGFLGWGRDELLGYLYWGGTTVDIQDYLRELGFNVHTASVGPVSSNHDRACELFYQIKGGQVDYGEDHANHFGHQRYGKTYPGIYPQWDADHPIHFIGHSMGGQTTRLLVELLADDFFQVGSNASWVKSISSVASPHNGTILATMIDTLSGGYAEEIIAALLALAGTDWHVYNFDLDHWNLEPLEDESLHEFLQRVDATLGKTTDISMYDLLPQGATDINNQVRTFPDVYYFSYANEETYVLDPLTDFEWGEPAMLPVFWGFAYYMGRYRGDDVSPNEDWWKNDGVVNTISMKGPANAQIVDYSGTPVPGIWQYMGMVDSKDHMKVVGHYQGPGFTGDWLREYYLDMATLLYQLP